MGYNVWRLRTCKLEQAKAPKPDPVERLVETRASASTSEPKEIHRGLIRIGGPRPPVVYRHEQEEEEKVETNLEEENATFEKNINKVTEDMPEIEGEAVKQEDLFTEHANIDVAADETEKSLNRILKEKYPGIEDDELIGEPSDKEEDDDDKDEEIFFWKPIINVDAHKKLIDRGPKISGAYYHEDGAPTLLADPPFDRNWQPLPRFHVKILRKSMALPLSIRTECPTQLT